MSQAVKKLYDNYCQVCDARLKVPGGSMSQGAHIRALGKPHSGPDVPENVLCFCPNHHALFDDGASTSAKTSRAGTTKATSSAR